MKRMLLGILAGVVAVAAQAEVHVLQPWSRATPPGVEVGVGYLALHNGGPKPARLVSMTSPRAAAVEMHESSLAPNGTSSMRPVKELVIPAGGMVTLQPNGKHLMLVGLKAPLKEGEHVPLTMTFQGEAPVQLELEVRSIGASAPAPASAPAGEHEHR